MAIKVLVISDYRDYHTTRPEGSIFLALAKQGFEIHIMTYKNQGFAKEFENTSIQVVNFHPQKKFDKNEIAKIRNYLISESIDILHVFNSVANINGIQAAKKLNVKILMYRGCNGNIAWYDPTQYFKYLSPKVDGIWCNSIGVEELFKRQLFFKAHKAVTINKGHDIKWYQGIEPAHIRKECNIPQDALLLINVANNRKMKGIPYLLRAMALLPKTANIHLLLVGRDMVSETNTAIIEKNNLQEKVHFLGFRKDALNLVAASDAFVLSSIKHESITKAVIEAMALKVAPIISDIRGNYELVKQDENGLIFPSKNEQAIANCILKVYQNRALCETFGEASYQHIQAHLNNKQAVDKMAEWYQNLLK